MLFQSSKISFRPVRVQIRDKGFNGQLRSKQLPGGCIDDLKQCLLLFPGNNEAVVDTENWEPKVGCYRQDLVGYAAVDISLEKIRSNGLTTESISSI